jgi:hypothetical protein
MARAATIPCIPYARTSYTVPIAAATALSILPLVLLAPYFSRLFWFGDELDLLSQIRHEGFLSWAINTFAENFVPLFKILWGGAVFLFNGSYFAMVCLVWATHALTLLLFGRLLERCGLSPFAVFLAVVTLGLPVTNIETLTWTVQWSAVLSITFFVLALLRLQEVFQSGSTAKSSLWWFTGWCTAATLSFSKGIIACAALAVAAGLYAMPRRQWRRGVLVAMCALLPAVIAASVILVAATGNHRAVASSSPHEIGEMVLFGVSHLLLNPFFRIFHLPLPIHDAVPYLLTIGVLKVVMVATVFSMTRRSRATTTLLSVLLVLDVMNSAVLGIGRYHEGLSNSVPSRYQYSSLVSTAPFIAILVERAVCGFSNVFFADSKEAIRVVAFATSSAWMLALGAGWGVEVPSWVRWRGEQGRDLLIYGIMWKDRPAEHGAWIGVPPFLPLEEARAVVKEYNLH